MDDEGITQDDLAIGPTRPSMIWPGVTYTAVIINIVLTTETVALTNNILWGLMFLPLHGICYLICLHDPRAFDLLVAWGRTKGQNLVQTRFYWKASSCSPLRLRNKPTLFQRWNYWTIKRKTKK